MSEGQVTCDCTKWNQPQWSYCSDDFYCPLCGEAVTRLVSKNRYPSESDDGAIWIYAQKGRDTDKPIFVFPLAVKYADQARDVQRRKPMIDFLQSGIPNNPYFREILQPADSAPDADRWPNRPYRVQLIPDGNEKELPSEGVQLLVPRVVGDFSRAEQLELRVGNKPSIRIKLTGPCLEQSKEEENLVRLTSADTLEVMLEIHAEDAPVLIKKALTNERVYCGGIETGDVPTFTGTVSLRLDRELFEGTVISPGHPWSTSATLFANDLTTQGQKITIRLDFDVLVASIDPRQLSLMLERVEKGGVEFSPRTFSVDSMYLGECRSNAHATRKENPEDPSQLGFEPVIGRLSIRNVGRERIILNSVTLKHDYSFDWVSVQWATDVSDGSQSPEQGQLELEPGERGEVYIRLDLRNVGLDQVPANRQLSAMIQIRQVNSEESIDYPLILGVRERIPCPTPLCIDFGNSSSYASIEWCRGFPTTLTADSGICDVHEMRLPESFPTVLFFKSAAENPFDSECEIGDMAVSEAELFAGRGGSDALVGDLKRWIGDTESKKSVSDPRGNSRRYLVSDLIVLFLKLLVERAEFILRKYTIQEICVSHPSKFDRVRRHKLNEIIDRVCDLITSKRQSKPLRRVKTDVDEANAVAVGAMFEPQIRSDFLREMFQNGRQSFVVGCLDLGGGSLDTAVIRFEVSGSRAGPRFQSQYLGIGGHSRFGGDNVTRAFQECILDQIRMYLEKHGLAAAEFLKHVPTPVEKDRCPESYKRHNYQILWEIAEYVKIHQCRHTGMAKPSEDIAKSELAALSNFVQTRLLNDFNLSPRNEGRGQSSSVVSGALKEFVNDLAFLIPLPEIYKHQIRNHLSGRSHTSASNSVGERIEDAIRELNDLAMRHCEKIDVVILAGAGSRLPLVGEVVNSEIPEARIIQDQSRMKFRVAHGLVRFLGSRVGGHKFACSSHYSTFAYEVGRGDGLGALMNAIPNCSLLKASETWYRVLIPTELTDGQEVDAKLHEIVAFDGTRFVHLFRVEEDQTRMRYGWFDLSRPPLNSSGCPPTPLTDAELESEEFRVDIRLVDSEDVMELRLSTSSNALRGVWELNLISDRT